MCPFALDFSGVFGAAAHAALVGNVVILMALREMLAAVIKTKGSAMKSQQATEVQDTQTRKRRHATWIHYALLGILLLILLVLAQIAKAEDGIEHLPLVDAGNGISYVTGGVGQDQQAAMREVRGFCNLHLTFALKGSGKYLADVHLHVRASDGKELLDVKAVGPLFYAHVPAGKYVIVAERPSGIQSKSTVAATGGSADLYFYWDDE